MELEALKALRKCPIFWDITMEKIVTAIPALVLKMFALVFQFSFSPYVVKNMLQLFSNPKKSHLWNFKSNSNIFVTNIICSMYN